MLCNKEKIRKKLKAAKYLESKEYTHLRFKKIYQKYIDDSAVQILLLIQLLIFITIERTFP